MIYREIHRLETQTHKNLLSCNNIEDIWVPGQTSLEVDSFQCDTAVSLHAGTEGHLSLSNAVFARESEPLDEFYSVKSVILPHESDKETEQGIAVIQKEPERQCLNFLL